MPRNLDRRVEAVTPVIDPKLANRLQEILDVNLADDVLAWTLGEDGQWRRVSPSGRTNTHDRLQELAQARARRDADRKAPVTSHNHGHGVGRGHGHGHPGVPA
jgi:polyphosphate kinase